MGGHLRGRIGTNPKSWFKGLPSVKASREGGTVKGDRIRESVRHCFANELPVGTENSRRGAGGAKSDKKQKKKYMDKNAEGQRSSYLAKMMAIRTTLSEKTGHGNVQTEKNLSPGETQCQE